MPDKIGGEHMASLLITPDLVEFIDNIVLEGTKKINVLEIYTDKLSKDIEDYFVRKVRQAGGRAYKFGQNGLPDRICVFPQGKVFFVELKRPGERPRPLQINRQKELMRLGAVVVPYIDTKKGWTLLLIAC